MMTPAHAAPILYVAETTDGLEFCTETELQGMGARPQPSSKGEVTFQFEGEPKRLLALKTAFSVSSVQTFAVPRPRGLLDNSNIRQLLKQVETAQKLSVPGSYKTFVVAAAGSDSSIMQRIKAVIAEATHLQNVDDKGDLWIRIRPNRAGQWQVLVRLTPRPLVTRPWRVCNLEGALNAATAHAMIMLTNPQPEDTFVNLGCGSGTLMIERLTHSSCRRVIGLDHQPEHLHCAAANLTAFQKRGAHLMLADMTQLPLEAAGATALTADLPFGQLVGSHHTNQQLYPEMLKEAARIARQGASFSLITHEIRLIERLLRTEESWAVKQVIPINLRGLHPRIYVLRRT